jgi:trk system potassium uptake protein TrkA
MYVVIVGSTEFASALASLLSNEDNEKVVLVVKKKEEALRITEEIGINVVNADATKPEILDDLELDKCDVFIAASELDKDNLLSAMYAKENGAKKIFACVDSSDIEAMVKKLGIIPINSERFAANAVELRIKRPAVSDLVNIGDGQFDIIEISASVTNLSGKKLGEATGKNFTALASYLNGKYNFSKEAKIIDKDTILLLVNAGKEKEAEKEIINPLKKIAMLGSSKK